MKLGKEFMAGAMIGAACGIAGVIRLGIYGAKKLCEDLHFEREVKSALIKTILGKDCTSYSFSRNGYEPHLNYKNYKDYSTECKSNESDESDEKAFAVMDICGVEGLYSDKWGELEKRLMRDCDIYEPGIYDSEKKERCTEDRFSIDGNEYYLYYLRGGKGDDPGAICTIEKGPVAVNFCGVFVTNKRLDIFGEKSYHELEDDDWGFTGEWMRIDDFISGEEWRQR